MIPTPFQLAGYLARVVPSAILTVTQETQGISLLEVTLVGPHTTMGLVVLIHNSEFKVYVGDPLARPPFATFTGWAGFILFMQTILPLLQARVEVESAPSHIMVEVML